LVTCGFVILERYSNSPGRAGAPPHRIAGTVKNRLLIFLHPECPCSTATIAELSRLMAERGPELSVTAYVFAPRSMGPLWASGGLYKSVQAIPGVNVKFDADGQFANAYGAYTSGQVLMYSGSGRLQFSGGITASRGHEGDNAGLDAIVGQVDHRLTVLQSTPVFGCALGGGTR